MNKFQSDMFQGRGESTAVKKYKQLVENKDKLFDVSADTEKRKLECEEEWGVKMTQSEKDYLLDQQTAR